MKKNTKIAKELLGLARELVAYNEAETQIESLVTKEDFLQWVLPRIKKIECYVTIKDNTVEKKIEAGKKKEVKIHHNKYKTQEDNSCNEDNTQERQTISLSLHFEKLKKKIKQWVDEGKHTQSFYGLDFIHDVLENNVPIIFIPRTDDPSKNDPARYGLGNNEEFRQFMIDKINNHELHFQDNEMGTLDGFPLDVFNTNVTVEKEQKEVVAYIKFCIKNLQSFEAVFDLEFDVISCHDK